MPIDLTTIETLGAAAAAGGGVATTFLSMFKLRPERRKLEAERGKLDAERERAYQEAGALAVETLKGTIQEAQAEISRLRDQVAELVAVNTRLESEVKFLRERIAALEGEHHS